MSQPFCVLCAYDGKEQDCDVATKQPGEKCTPCVGRDHEKRVNGGGKRVSCDRTKKSASTLRANAAQNQTVLAVAVMAPVPAPVAAQVAPVVNQYYIAGPETSHKRKASDERGMGGVLLEQTRKIMKLENQLEQRSRVAVPDVSRHEVRMNHLERCLDDAVMARVNAEVEVQELKRQLVGEQRERAALWSANQDLRGQVRDYESAVARREREKRELGMEGLNLRGKVKASEGQVKDLGGGPAAVEARNEEVKGEEMKDEEVKVKKEEGSERADGRNC
ncbi:hypothetical protein LTR56_017312 [Elasticomyces elasticus]|nr:hypothetical protein LTR56_017312 [Elasticomyces elasticus]KAK3639386.1 hypothetical protein LTR22_017420 [Elasticomyces elasticus]KAK4924571.1 hypothetical protein LTR49_008254 [Elasticomyces elasticus]KAK5763079.1 hypothetical protein LTS12_006863 [Elasticomyces elasticus]